MSESSSSGMGFPGALTIVFITLKVTHVVDWSWWWVLAPLWIATGLWITLLGLLLAMTAVCGWWD